MFNNIPFLFNILKKITNNSNMFVGDLMSRLDSIKLVDYSRKEEKDKFRKGPISEPFVSEGYYDL